MQVFEVVGAIAVIFAATGLAVIVLGDLGEGETPAGRTRNADPYESALPRLRERAAASPRLAALLDEVDRGRARREEAG